MPPTPDDVRRIMGHALSPGHFFVRPPLRLEWEHVAAEEVSWELFRGRLLDSAHTRQRRTFESWNVYLLGAEGRSAEPLLSVKWDLAAGELHIVRAVLCYVHEGYDAGGNVMLTREVGKWVRELVCTLPFTLRRPPPSAGFGIHSLLFRAVIGTSRLPLTSVEAPLPGFSLGELGYFPQSQEAAGPMTSPRELIERGLVGACSFLERVKLLELMLRSAAAGEVESLARLYSNRDERVRLQAPHYLRVMFNEVSLSPYTDFVEMALLLVRAWEQDGCLTPAAVADFLSHLLRQTSRHLTAYDLVRFHHAGANYPDALLLDAVLRELLTLIERRPALFLDSADDDEPSRKAKRLRRRGLRQGWLIRRRYRGHPVPDIPTSPGENARVMPAPHLRVPEEQILQPQRRTKQLFTAEVLLGETARTVLRQSVLDLHHPLELRELGTALYLDRPLGAFKAPGEPDQTILLSYIAFSRSIAMQRLLQLGEATELLPAGELVTLKEALQALQVKGVPVADVPAIQRPGVVSLADAARTAPDFVLLRTTSLPAHMFLLAFRFEPLGERLGIAEWWGNAWFILGRPEEGTGEIMIAIHEAGTLRKRIELSMDPRDGYIIRGGVEFPRKGLRARRIWEEEGGEWRERDLTGEELFAQPR